MNFIPPFKRKPITQIIMAEELTKKDISVSHLKNYLISIATIFLSSGVIFDLYGVIPNSVLIIMTIFMGVFLPFNEYTKVTELVKFYPVKMFTYLPHTIRITYGNNGMRQFFRP